jgi:signal peptidase II
LAPTDDVVEVASKPVRASARTLALLGAIALLVYGLDQLSKYLILTSLTEGQSVSVLGEVLQFRLVKNSGAAFSLGSGYTWIFVIIASAVVVFIVLFAHRIRSLGWATVFGLLLGGTLGNLSDRLFREPGFGSGHVVDFVQLYLFPAIFNVADVAISSAMVVFILLTLRGVGLDGVRAVRSTPAGDTES